MFYRSKDGKLRVLLIHMFFAMGWFHFTWGFFLLSGGAHNWMIRLVALVPLFFCIGHFYHYLLRK